MMKIKELVRDVVRTLFWFMFETFYSITYFFEVILTSIYKFVIRFIVPTLFDLMVDIYHVLQYMCYEGCMVSSSILLEFGKLLTNASEYLLIKAEQISGRSV